MVDNDVFDQKSVLNPKIWKGEQLDSSIKSILLKIANDFFEDLELEGSELEDITFTGSLANFNYTKFSDIDLHLLVDYSKIDENSDLVGEYFRSKTSLWNQKHKIFVKSYEVEIYVQDINEKHHSTGVYSIQNDIWKEKPGQKPLNYDKSVVKKKVKSFIGQVEDIEGLYDDKKYEEANNFAKKLVEKIKKFRKSGLESDGEYSNENLVFKILRNEQHIKELYDLRTKSYDKMMSLNGKHDKKFKIYISQEATKEIKGFDKLHEEELYQRKVKSNYRRLKKQLTSHGNQPAGPAFPLKASSDRGPSAPPGAGGS